MNVLVVTNNPAAGEKLEKLGLRVEFTKGNAKRSLLHARDLIIKGWHLAADPRGGYNKRYNPCKNNLCSCSADSGYYPVERYIHRIRWSYCDSGIRQHPGLYQPCHLYGNLPFGSDSLCSNSYSRKCNSDCLYRHSFFCEPTDKS